MTLEEEEFAFEGDENIRPPTLAYWALVAQLLEEKPMPRKRSRCPWIIACDGSHPDHPYGFECLRCGATEKVPDHMRLEVWLVWAKAFERSHKDCKEKPA